MKRAKIVLTGVALFAVIGGALAIKATRIAQPLFKTNAAGLCVSPTTLSYTTAQQFPNQPISTITSSLYTTPVQGPCPRTTWYSAL